MSRANYRKLNATYKNPLKDLSLSITNIHGFNPIESDWFD